MNTEDRASDIVFCVDQIADLIKEKATPSKIRTAFAELQEAVDMYEMAAMPSPARI